MRKIKTIACCLSPIAFDARLASEIFLSSLQPEFFSKLLVAKALTPS